MTIDDSLVSAPDRRPAYRGNTLAAARPAVWLLGRLLAGNGQFIVDTAVVAMVIVINFQVCHLHYV